MLNPSKKILIWFEDLFQNIDLKSLIAEILRQHNIVGHLGNFLIW